MYLVSHKILRGWEHWGSGKACGVWNVRVLCGPGCHGFPGAPAHGWPQLWGLLGSVQRPDKEHQPSAHTRVKFLTPARKAAQCGFWLLLSKGALRPERTKLSACMCRVYLDPCIQIHTHVRRVCTHIPKHATWVGQFPPLATRASLCSTLDKGPCKCSRYEEEDLEDIFKIPVHPESSLGSLSQDKFFMQKFCQ